MGTDRPMAIATTKRKFTQLLDNLAAGTSTTSLASTLRASNASTASLEHPGTPPTKRSRLSDVGMDGHRTFSGSRVKALQDQLLTPRKDGSRIVGAGIRAVGSDQTPVNSSTPRKAPNFQPYSQEHFLERLKTFADVTRWTNKPDTLDEVEWAKRGWTCDSWNTVACKGGCEQRVAIKLRPKRKDAEDKEIEMSEDLAEDIDVGLLEKYQDLIVNGHHEDCLWKKVGCKDEIYHLAIPNRAKSSAELLDRYRSFKAIAADLPLLEHVIYPDPPIADVLKRTPTTFFSPPTSTTEEGVPTSPSDLTAFTCALFGWTGVSESKISLAACNHCFQRVGLWLYKEDRLNEMSTKLEVPIESLRLNLLESHREYCPWKNPVTQGNPHDGLIKDMAAWETLEFMLMGKKREHRHVESVDLGSGYRGSFESVHGSASLGETAAKDDDSLNERWKRLKARLRRTTSKKSLKRAKSVKSVGEKDKENGKVKSP